MAKKHRLFFRLAFGSIIRAASNADPVPVSGLEVTSHMKRREEEGRRINPFDLFRRSVNRALKDWEEYEEGRQTLGQHGGGEARRCHAAGAAREAECGRHHHLAAISPGGRLLPSAYAGDVLAGLCSRSGRATAVARALHRTA